MGLFGPKEYKPENPVKSIRQVSTDTQDIQKEIDTGSALSRKFLIVDELPDTGVTDTIYLVPKENTRKGGTQEIYDEYIYIEETGKFERIGSTEVDLSGYAKKTDLFDYSTDEQVVGKWIDGKPLYQRTFSFTTPSNDGAEHYIELAQTVNTDLAFAAEAACIVVVPWGSPLVEHRQIMPIPNGINGTNYYFSIDTYNNSLGLIMKVADNNWAGKDAYVTIKYTKTTD